MVGTTTWADEPPAKSSDSYPIRLNAKEVRQLPKLSIEFGNLKLTGEHITVVPMSTEAGVTGAVLFGNGDYSYQADTEKKFDGHFYAIMLRFNPKDGEKVLPLNKAKQTEDEGASALAKALLASSFRHCYHRGQEALLPNEGAIAADVISRELGDVLFSSDGKTSVVHNFSENKTLFANQ
jgi:hypothetical protein